MIDVMVRKGEDAVILCPGQAVPVYAAYSSIENLYDVEMWLMTAKMEGQSIYTDLAQDPIPIEDITNGAAQHANCTKPFGLEVIRMTGNVLGVYAMNPPYRMGDFRHATSLKAKDFISFAKTATPVLNSYEDFAPAFYVKMTEDAPAEKGEVELYDCTIDAIGRFVRLDLPILLSCPDRGKVTQWKRDMMRYAAGASSAIQWYLSSNPQYEGKVYVSFGPPPAGFKTPERLVNRKDYEELRLFSGRSPRRLVHLPVCTGDLYAEVDGDRTRICNFTQEALRLMSSTLSLF